MGQPIQHGGRYVDFLPAPQARVRAGELADVRNVRHLLVVFSLATAPIEGWVRLKGPITDPGPEGQSAGEDFSGGSYRFNVRRRIRDDPGFGGRYRAAIFGTPGDVAETGFYRMEVEITSPEWMKPINDEGGITGNLRYQRNVWVQYDCFYQERDEPEEESTEAVRVVSVTVYQKATVIGDPIFLELPYLVQHGSHLPGLMRLMNYSAGRGSAPAGFRQPRSTGGQRFMAHLEAFRGAVKKSHSYIGQLINVRAAYRSIRLDSGTTRFLGSWRDEAAWLAAAGHNSTSPAMNQELFDSIFEENMRIGGRDQRLTSVFPEGGELPQPGRRSFNALDVNTHVGNFLDVVELGINVWKFRQNITSSGQAEQALNDALSDMADDMKHSVFKDFELEAFRHIFVRRQADNSHLLFSAGMTMLGWIPGLGWPWAIGNFVAGIVANRAQDRIRDYFEPRQNPELIASLRARLSDRGYEQAFPRTGNAAAKKNRKLIQLIIRSKLLYDLKRLVDEFQPEMSDDHPDFRTNELRREHIYQLIHLLVRKDVWYMQYEVALGTSPTWFYTGEDSSSITDNPPARFASHYVPVHFQDYFPIDCYCGSIRQFSGWFKDDIELGVHDHWEHNPPGFEIRFKNFESHRFDNRVWAVVFRIPDMNIARFRESQRDSLDVRQDQWARNLTSMIDQVEHALSTAENFETALRDPSEAMYRRNQGETVSSGSEEIPHIESGPDGCLRARIFQSFDLAQNGYLILSLTNSEREGQPRGAGDILYQRYQFLCGEERAFDGRAPGIGPAVWDVEGDYLVRRDRRHRFR